MSTAMKAGRAAVLATALVLGVPAGAQADGAPIVTTGAISGKTTTSVTLNGRVNPNGAVTRYHFEIGLTRSYGTSTAVLETGNGSAPQKVSAVITGLAPATRYHYRLIAENRFAIRRGEDRAFKTAREPLGLTLGATPNPVFAGQPTNVVGQLSGTGNAGRAVQLQLDTFPYDAWIPTSNPVVTDAAGAFTFPILAVPVNTLARVLMPDKPEVQSPVIALQALVRVRTEVKAKKRKGGAKKVTFSGTVAPAIDGEQLQLQRLVDGNWEIVRTMRAKHRTKGPSSSYSKTLKVGRTSRFRVYANVASGMYTSSAGAEKKIKVKR